VSVKKKSQEGKIETSPDGILLREMLDVLVDSKPESDFDNFEAAFKKSREEEQERAADFVEWIEDIAQQSHPESDIEYDLMEPAPQTEEPGEPGQNEAAHELTADYDELVPEADADTVEPRPDRKEEKVEDAERPL
jgi:hypothetical protein